MRKFVVTYMGSMTRDTYVDRIKADGFKTDHGILIFYKTLGPININIAAYKEYLRVHEDD